MQPLYISINNIGDVKVKESPEALSGTPEWRQIGSGADDEHYPLKIHMALRYTGYD